MSRWEHVGPTTPQSLFHALWRQTNVERGRCWECKEPAAHGRKRCEKHLRIHRERQRARKAAEGKR